MFDISCVKLISGNSAAVSTAVTDVVIDSVKMTSTDKHQALIEQTLYAIYLASVGISFKNFTTLAVKCSDNDDEVANDLGRVLSSIIRGQDITPVNFDRVLDVFRRGSSSCTTITISYQFIVQLAWMLGCPITAEEYPEGVIEDGRVYYPCFKNINGITIANEGTTCAECKCLTLYSEVANASFIRTPHENSNCGNVYVTRLLQHYVFRAAELTQLIGMLASFSVPRLQYDIAVSNELQLSQFLYAVCYDVVSEKDVNTARMVSQDAGAAVFSNFINYIRNKVMCNELVKVTDTDFFAEIVQMCCKYNVTSTSNDLIAYCTKPISRITAMEALSYRSSIISGILADRMMAAMEAESAVPSEQNEEDTTGNSQETETSDDDQSIPEEDDNLDSTEKSVDDKPVIDPGMMLLEIVNTSDTMSSYMYRNLIGRRITSILRNPPENAKPDDLLMLKRWKSRWLYMVSVPCIKEFISRVAIRLSD